MPGVDEEVKNSAEAQAFFTLVNKALAASRNTELLIHVHGSNDTVPRSTGTTTRGHW